MQNNIQLSPHFELREFTESATARGYGIVNEPPPEAVENLKALCVNTLEPLREALGLPIIITSGYRCKALNELITHHSTRSQHRTGEAADFWVQGSRPELGSRFKVQGSKCFASGVADQGVPHHYHRPDGGLRPAHYLSNVHPCELHLS